MNDGLIKEKSTISTEGVKRKKIGKKSSLNIIMVSPKPGLVKRLKETAKDQNTDMGSLVEAIIEDWFLLKKKENASNERLSEMEKNLDELAQAFKNETSSIRKNLQALKTKSSEEERAESTQKTIETTSEKNEKAIDALEGIGA